MTNVIDQRQNSTIRGLTPDMKRVIAEQRLAFVATVCPDGTPNLSPKGTIAALDDLSLTKTPCGGLAVIPREP